MSSSDQIYDEVCRIVGRAALELREKRELLTKKNVTEVLGSYIDEDSTSAEAKAAAIAIELLE